MFVGANSGQYSASRSGEYSFSRGMLRRTALLLAPSVAASSPPPKPCSFTKQDLMGLLKEAGYDATSPAYKAYFFKNGESTGKGCRYHRTNLDEDVDRCKECGCTIAEHHPAAVETAEAPSLEDLILRMNAVGTTPSSRIASGKLKDLIAGAANSVLRGVPYVKSETAR